MIITLLNTDLEVDDNNIIQPNNTDVKSNVSIDINDFEMYYNIVKIFQNGTQFFATFYGKDGKPLANNTDVTFNINGVFYTRQTNENGTARLNINLIPGKYILTAINPANNEEKGFNVTVLSNVETANLVKYYKNESQLIIQVYRNTSRLHKQVRHM